MNITQTEPSVETERELNRAHVLLESLRAELPEIWHREQADEILASLHRTRTHFRDYMMEVADERVQLIESRLEG